MARGNQRAQSEYSKADRGLNKAYNPGNFRRTVEANAADREAESIPSVARVKAVQAAREYMRGFAEGRAAEYVPMQNKEDIKLYSNQEHPGFVTDGGDDYGVEKVTMTTDFNHKEYGYPNNYSRKDVIRALVVDALDRAVENGMLTPFNDSRGPFPRSTPEGIKEFVQNFITDVTEGKLRKIDWNK
jgi:hypothetical protein